MNSKKPILTSEKLFGSLIAGFNLIYSINGNMIETEYPNEEYSNSSSHAYEFVPVSTVIGFSVLGVSFLLLAIAKVIFASSDQYMANNRYDLVIFKQVTSKQQVHQRLVNTNNANVHNLNAAAACGFDISMLQNRSSFSPVFTMSASQVKTN